MNTRALYQIITEQYTNSEDFRKMIWELTFEHGDDLSYSNLGGDSTPMAGKARELVLKIRRYEEPYRSNVFNSLVQIIKQQRPHADLSAIGGGRPFEGMSETAVDPSDGV